jgi:photosystem II stability/assembly factor-like uncharacterized protein
MAVGSGGKILRTTNGGANWTLQTSGSTISLQNVSFINSNTGIVVGSSSVLFTKDGGTTWVQHGMFDAPYVYGVYMFDSLTATLVGYNSDGGVIYKTIDGGANWTKQPCGTLFSLTRVQFINANIGTVVGQYGTILRTSDGGTTWASQSHGVKENLYSAYFLNSNTGTVVGNTGTIIRTTDGGNNWIEQTAGTTAYNFLNAFFVNANTGTVVGYDGDLYTGVILRTTNGGTNWTLQSSELPGYFWSVHFIDANTGTAVGSSGKIYRTTNGGANWDQQVSGNTYVLYSVFFTDANTGTIVGTNGSNSTAVILRTTNGGTNWDSQTSSAAGLMGVFFTDANTGTAVGMNGTIIRTTNGGVNWNAQTSGGPQNHIYGVCFSDVNNGVTVGAGGNIRRTTNGGATWTFESNPSTNELHSVCLTNGIATAVGLSGVILRNNSEFAPNIPALVSPINGALNQSQTPKMKWQSVSGAISYRIQVSVDSTFATTAFDSTGITRDSIVVPSGKLLTNTKYYWRVNATNPGGTSDWSAKFNFTVTATGVNSIVSGIPKEYKLYNNYPNPFNPTTKIKFDVPTNGFTKISIYDMLGREVKTLVNEKLTAGTYEIEWNALNYASGIYFCKMHTDAFTSFKKMVLVK